jgi:type II secretory pathway pseudopilin PulG
MIKELPSADPGCAGSFAEASCRLPIDSGERAPRVAIVNRKSSIVNAFSMVELLVAMTLLSLIVLVLMTVFNSTQTAFQASVTQTDILEGSRAAMDLITTDLRGMVPCDGVSNYVNQANNNNNNNNNNGITYGSVNFFVTNNTYEFYPFYYEPLVQPLPGSTAPRTNLLQYFFVLGRVNTKWTAAGYVVDSSSASPLYPLYRYYAEANIMNNPVGLYSNFLYAINNAQWTNLSHVMDGVTHLVVRPYDAAGYRLTNGYNYLQTKRPQNVWFSPPEWGEVGSAFYSNAVPAAVELQLGVLEDRVLQRAESLGLAGTPPMKVPAQWSYLQSQAGHVQVFRQRVTIPNVDLTAYQ